MVLNLFYVLPSFLNQYNIRSKNKYFKKDAEIYLTLYVVTHTYYVCTYERRKKMKHREKSKKKRTTHTYLVEHLEFLANETERLKNSSDSQTLIHIIEFYKQYTIEN